LSVADGVEYTKVEAVGWLIKFKSAVPVQFCISILT
jgi:hypothetical protein